MKDLTVVCKALSDSSRLRIYRLVAQSRELCVCDIEAAVGFSQTKVSRHLAVLRKAQLVHVKREGLWKLYSSTLPKSDSLRDVVRALLRTADESPICQRDSRSLNASIERGSCAATSLMNIRIK